MIVGAPWAFAASVRTWWTHYINAYCVRSKRIFPVNPMQVWADAYRPEHYERLLKFCEKRKEQTKRVNWLLAAATARTVRWESAYASILANPQCSNLLYPDPFDFVSNEYSSDQSFSSDTD